MWEIGIRVNIEVLYIYTCGPFSGPDDFTGRAVSAHVSGVWPKLGLVHWAVLAWARTTLGRAVLVPCQNTVLRAVPMGHGLHGHL